jgi:DNA mismatch repair protein MutS
MATPMFEQYAEAKAAHPNEILFFRMGDFYEMFYEDARTANRVLGLALTSRSREPGAPPMAGVPFHQKDVYIAKLIRAGYRVAVCEQVEDPKLAKGLVKREVIQVVTAGTVTADTLLDEKKPNYLLAICPDGEKTGLAWVDLSTGCFETTDTSAPRLMDDISRVSPAEILIPETILHSNPAFAGRVKSISPGATITPCPDWTFEHRAALRTLTDHFGTSTLSGFGLTGTEIGIRASGAALSYLLDTQKCNLTHIGALKPFASGRTLRLDRATRISLELVETMREREKKGALLHLLDRTRTPMGARLMREWILSPLADLNEIMERQAGVAEFFEIRAIRGRLQDALKNISDIERLCSRISTGSCSARDVAGLGRSLSELPKIHETLQSARSPIISNAAAGLDSQSELADVIRRAIEVSPPLSLREGGLIRDGYNSELDELRKLKREGKNWMANFQAEETSRTGIKNLKVGYNRVFGYYIEVTNAGKTLVPVDYVRKQTIKNAERYITEALKSYEEKILNAEERGNELEYNLFNEVRLKAAEKTPQLQKIARKIAVLDVLAALAETALERAYCRPEVNDSEVIEIVDGRHPVLDAGADGSQFVPNSAYLDNEDNRLMIITGPNMAGKSTYIRQVALIVLMAQMGSYIPAKSARIGIVDGIFTRVGASDEIHRGQSTFMVEMTETANILNNATSRSLIILDEVGRGTSTYDGVSLAWAITEHIHTKIKARTLFATHYHELVALEQTLKGLKNFNIAVSEWQDQIIFLRKIVPGGTDKSYGLHVARLAGIPKEVISRAKAVLANLESAALDGEDMASFVPPAEVAGKKSMQLTFFKTPAEKVVEMLKKIDVNSMTPLESLSFLSGLKEELRKEDKQ